MAFTDNGDGTASYRRTGTLNTAFRVNIADITGFAVRRHGVLEQTFVVFGNGTELAQVNVNHGTSEKIEAWLRSHPLFRGNSPAAVTGGAPSAPGAGELIDQLARLADLHASGALTDAEFSAAKRRLLESGPPRAELQEPPVAACEMAEILKEVTDLARQGKEDSRDPALHEAQSRRQTTAGQVHRRPDLTAVTVSGSEGAKIGLGVASVVTRPQMLSVAGHQACQRCRLIVPR